MKLTMRRAAAPVALMTLAPLALAACASESSAQTDGKTELTFLTYSVDKSADGTSLFQNIIDQYEADHPDVTITLDVQAQGNSTDFLKKLDLMQAGGKTADIIQLPSYREYATRAGEGYFADLTTLAPDFEDTYAYPAAVDGSIYALPFDPALYLTFINKSLLDAAGQALPTEGWTWDDYATLAARLTSGSGADKVYGSYMHTWPEFRHEGLYNSILDNPYVTPEGTVNFDDPQFADWLTYIKQLESAGVQVPYADAKATSMAYATEFLSGRVAMVVMGSWMLDSLRDLEKYPHDWQTVFAPFPVWADGAPGVTQGSASYLAMGAGIDEAEQKAAYDFMEYFVDEGAASQQKFSSKKGADNGAVLAAKFEGAQDLADVASAQEIWRSPNLVANMVTRDAAKYVEIDEIFNTQTDAFMLGAQDLDTTLTNIATEAELVLDR